MLSPAAMSVMSVLMMSLLLAWAERMLHPWSQVLTDAVSALTNARYNFTLCNLYQTGNNHISYHSDDERFLGARACCSTAAVSLVPQAGKGARRTGPFPAQPLMFSDGQRWWPRLSWCRPSSLFSCVPELR